MAACHQKTGGCDVKLGLSAETVLHSRHGYASVFALAARLCFRPDPKSVTKRSRMTLFMLPDAAKLWF